MIGFRRGRREEYLTLRLPELWVGEPPRLPVVADLDPGILDEPVTGIAAARGSVTGRVRVVVDSDGCDELTAGEILVCSTTDPSWAAAFRIAAAVVIDIGGVMSHGAIVAREFGLPCVINTRTGTRTLRTGDLVRVDGDAGRVDVLERAEAAASAVAVEPRPAGPPPTDTAPYDEQRCRVLQLLRLKGRAATEGIAEQLRLDEPLVERLVSELLGAGAVKQSSSGYRITDAGRSLLDVWLRHERQLLDEAGLAELYREFCDVNDLVKQLITDWQTRDGGGNDHGDAAYDSGVIGRLGVLHEQVLPMVERAGVLAPRLQPYAERLATASRQAAAGNPDYVANPLIDSYHTVWFELHEELMGLCGLDRADEAIAGRAV